MQVNYVMQVNYMEAVRSRWIPAFALSVAVTLAMFWLMNGVITGGGHGAGVIDVMPSIDFVRLRRDSEVQPMERRRPPPPPPPEQPPPPTKMTVASESVQSASPTPFSMPNLGLSTSVSGGPFIGEMGGSAPDMSGLFDGDIIPLQRMAPQYPRDASRAGITGWVQLEVLVNADGSVRSAKVLDAKPKGLFEAPAVAAVLKWKFKPKVVNGTPVAQRGSQKIEFNISK